MLARNDALEARLRHVETKPSLDLDAVDVAIERIRRPEVLRERIGDALLYAQRVEAEVGGLSIETLLPTSRVTARPRHASLGSLACSPTCHARRTPSRCTIAPPATSLDCSPGSRA